VDDSPAKSVGDFFAFMGFVGILAPFLFLVLDIPQNRGGMDYEV
jgi:hypothetical protein